MSQLHCPVDGTGLVEGSCEGIRVQRCPSCRGMWLDRVRLDAILDMHGREREDRAPVAPDPGSQAYELARQKQRPVRRCPACATDMEAREYARVSEVLVDACPRCHGRWLDAGELEQLEAFVERTRQS